MQKEFQNELAKLKNLVSANNPRANLALIEDAFNTSFHWHAGQKRESGEPYFTHPLAVASMLAQKGLDEKIVCAALLHDIIEDTEIDRKIIKEKFGDEIYGIVDALTKLDMLAFKSRREQSVANLVKTIMASSKDLRVLLIKIYDKLHNMRTIRFLPKEKQERIAADALTVYVPLTHQLGMHELKYELEDICFQVLQPKEYVRLKKEVAKSRAQKSGEIGKAIMMLKKEHPKEEWTFQEKKKSVYSIYSKMIAQNKKLSEINDALILKIIVPSEQECYTALGKVHSVFKPIPKKTKDYIAIPEYGIYQSLHTQVIGPSKKPLKVYIFSKEMDRIANDGIAALMCSSEPGKIKLLEQHSKRFAKIGIPEIMDNRDISSKLNLDFHNRAMIVFTSEGNVLNIPMDSTALDFAYFADEKRAQYASKAEINGKIVPLWTRLNAGETVKIHHSFINQFSSIWLGFVHSEKAKHLIEKELTKSGKVKQTNRLVKFELQAIDRPGLLADQSAIIAKHGLDMEIIKAICSTQAHTCKSEIFVRNSEPMQIQKAIKDLRDMNETLDLKVDYFQ